MMKRLNYWRASAFFFRRASLPLCVGCLLLGLASSLRAEPDPNGKVGDPDIVQKRVKDNLSRSDFEQKGYMEVEGKKQEPFTLKAKGREVWYKFTNTPLQIHIVVGNNDTKVETRATDADKWAPVSGSKHNVKILGSDITYGDLSFDFIRWDPWVPLGTESIKTMPTYAYEVKSTEGGPYDKVRFWILKDQDAPIRADAYNAKGEIIKRLELNGVTKIGNTYLLQELVVSTRMPGRDLPASRTWLKMSN